MNKKIFFLVSNCINLIFLVPTINCYNCKSPEQLKELNEINKFTINQNLIYIFLKDKLIGFQLPFFELTNTLNYFIIGQTFEYTNSFPPTVDRTYGYLYDLNRATYEINNLNRTEFIIYRLNFIIEIIQNESSILDPFLMNKIVDNQLTTFVKDKIGLNYSSDLKLIVGYFTDYYKTFLNIQYLANSKQKIVYFKDGKLNSIEKEMKHNVDYGILYFIKLEQNENVDHILIELDLKKLNFHFYQFQEFQINDLVSNLNFSSVNYSISLEDFFNCPKPFERADEVKGIIYAEQTQTFYIFINRYYLKVQDNNSIKNGILISSSDYANAQKFKFNDNELLRQIRFEYKYTKYVLSILQKPFLRLYSPKFLFSIDFELPKQIDKRSTDLNNLIFNEVTEKQNFTSELKKCTGQILTVKNILYCFQSNVYFKLYNYESNEIYPIDHLMTYEMFDNKTKYKKDQKMELIFEYGNDSFIMMTESHLFLINYKFVIVNPDLSLKISSNISEYDNCLFNGYCNEKKKVKDTDDKKIKEDEDERARKETKTTDSEILIIILAFLAFIILIICLIKSILIKKKKSGSRTSSQSKIDENGTKKGMILIKYEMNVILN